MMQETTLAAPAPPSATEPVALATALGVEDASVVLALIAEVDAIFCATAEFPVCRRPTPPAIGCALCEPRRAGRSSRAGASRAHGEPVRQFDPMQRSPPGCCQPTTVGERR